MKNRSFYICAAIFAILTAAKLFVPEHSDELREKVMTVVEGEDDYARAITAMGEKLYTGQLKEELVQAFNEAARKAFPEEAAEIVSTVEERGGTDIPDNVSTEQPIIPFEYCCPVAGIDSSGFGYREHPLDGEIKFHYGTDYAAATGDAVLSFADGYVYAAGCDQSYGNYLIIEHDEGYRTLYAHLSTFEITEGSSVTKGELIARVGQSGKATGPHLHFELMQGNMYLDPEYYV